MDAVNEEIATVESVIKERKALAAKAARDDALKRKRERLAELKAEAEALERGG